MKEPNKKEANKTVPEDVATAEPKTQWQEDDELSSKGNHWQNRIYDFIESTPVIIFMMTITIWVLFGDDIRQLTVIAPQDDWFYHIVLGCFFFFFLEIILTFYSKPEYRWSFFFYLDIISTVSLLMDVAYISNIVFGEFNSASNPKSAASFAKTARASRIGTRASRIVRIVRLIRLIRVVKLYKATKQAELKDEKNRNRRKKKAEKGVKGTSSGKIGAGSGQIQVQTPSGQLAVPSANPVPGTPNASNKNNLGLANAGGNLDPKKMVSGSIQQGSDGPNNLAVASSKIDSEDPNLMNEDGLLPGDMNEKELLKESNAGKQLSDLTTKRVIILILSIMISIPIFSIDTYWADFSSYQSGLRNLMYLLNKNTNYKSNDLFLKAWKNYVDLYGQKSDASNILVKLNLIQKNSTFPDSIEDLTDKVLASSNTTVLFDGLDYANTDLRDYEKRTLLEPDNADNLEEGQFSVIATFDVSGDFILTSYLSIGRTVFVCLVLSASAVLFSKDAYDLVLDPIEKMLAKVKRITENPLEAARVEENDAILLDGFKDKLVKSKDQENYETNILEKTITKIGTLLAVGLGQAGGEIATNNIKKAGEVDPMVPGKKVVGVFGYCDIRYFSDVAEVLQEGVASCSIRF